MAQKKEFLKILTPPFRVAWPQLETPKAFANSKPFYSIMALFPKATDLSDLKNLAKKVRDQKWPTLPDGLRNPFRDGKEKQFDQYIDCFFISAKTLNKPALYSYKGGGAKPEILTNPRDIYSGCWARASLTCYPYHVGNNLGVAFGLLAVQKLKDDTPINLMPTHEDDFTALEGWDSAPTTQGGGDDW